MSDTVYTSGGGSAAVGDAKAKLTYIRKGVSIKPVTAGDKPEIYIPLTNPSVTTDKLTKLSIESDGASGATITEAWVYFGKDSILNSSVTSDTNGYSVTVASDSQKADTDPYGINVTLKLNLPNADSEITLYSVTLTFSSK